MAGRRGHDKNLKDLTGAKDRPAGDVLIPAQAPPMPAYFAQSPALKAVWVEVVTDLDRLNRLSTSDSGTVEGYCIALNEVRELTEGLTELQVMYDNAKGDSKGRFTPEMEGLNKTMSKARASRIKAMQQLRQYAVEMGCTPASRGKVAGLLQGDLFGDKGNNAWKGFQ